MALAQDAAPSNAPRSDGQIEMDVVHALDGSQALKNDLITAATIQSEVTLSGTVSSDSSKQLAESIAKTVPGVTKVHNNLKVGNPADDANAQGAPANDPSNGMADAQAGPPQDNGQNPNYNQNPGPSRVRRASTRLRRRTGATRISSNRLMGSSRRPTGRTSRSSSLDTGSRDRLRDTGSKDLLRDTGNRDTGNRDRLLRDTDKPDRLRDMGSRRLLRGMDSARIMRRLRLRRVMRCREDRLRFRREP